MVSSLRSIAFALFQLIVTPVYAMTVLLLFWLPPVARYRYITGWCGLNLWGARWICGDSEAGFTRGTWRRLETLARNGGGVGSVCDATAPAPERLRACL